MKKVLIANRGEIAVRIARACRDYGVESVAVYADSDAEAVHVGLADEAYGLDGDRPADSYLDIGKLLDAARRSGADAVHPGYGFLSESSAFARAVIDAGLTWIGPPPESIDLLGDKVAARRLAKQVGAPLVPGTQSTVAGADEVMAFVEKHGLPIAIKAAFGGGGRGLKVAWRIDEVAELFDSAVREAVIAFGRGECFVEQYLDRPRHIEAQILADAHGTVVVLGTRDCSLQRRNQKLIEEAPAPFLTGEQRERIHTAARDICAAGRYQGAGTVEFLVSVDGKISFLEVNTRLQVEHPVTEETTGVDIVLEQFRIAEGLPLEIIETPDPVGHAFEFRINAEDAGRGFLPTPGRIERFMPPSGPGIRLDSGVVAGSLVPGLFDSMLAKLIVTGATRQQALARARRALREFKISGVASVLPFYRAVLQDQDFVAEDRFGVHTRWIETEFAQRVPLEPLPEPDETEQLTRTWAEIDGRRVRLGLPTGLLHGLAAGVSHGVGGSAAGEPGDSDGEPDAGESAVIAPVTGTLSHWLVADGATVAAGDTIAVIEAMKMETKTSAHRAGTIELQKAAGEFLTSGSVIACIS